MYVCMPLCMLTCLYVIILAVDWDSRDEKLRRVTGDMFHALSHGVLHDTHGLLNSQIAHVNFVTAQ